MAVLKAFGDVFQDAWLELFKAKLGVTGEGEDDRLLVSDFLELMHQGEADFTLTFRALSKVAGGAAVETLLDLFTVPPPGLSDWLTRWRARISRRTRGRRAPGGDGGGQSCPDCAEPPHRRGHRSCGLRRLLLLPPSCRGALPTLTWRIPTPRTSACPPTPDERVTRTFCGT
ncbi:MAG: hypothetical protein U5N27_02025 [Rhizobium sp.]|nr:hypothetical protein [Rhizobium sp.]